MYRSLFPRDLSAEMDRLQREMQQALLPEDADPDAVDAKYRDGIVHITIQRRASAQPRRIAIQ